MNIRTLPVSYFFHILLPCAYHLSLTFKFFFLYFQQPANAAAAPPPYPIPAGNNAANPAKRFKQGEEAPVVTRPAFYLSQQQLQMLHYLQQAQNLNPKQQALLQQLTQQFKSMQQHQQQLRFQQQLRAGQAGGVPAVRPGQSPQAQQFPQNQSGFQQHPGNRTPQSGTTAQTGFVNDGNFSPATGHSQQTAGMPFKSAGGFQQQPISSTTSNSDLSKYCCSYHTSVTSISLVFERISIATSTSIMLVH